MFAGPADGRAASEVSCRCSAGTIPVEVYNIRNNLSRERYDFTVCRIPYSYKMRSCSPGIPVDVAVQLAPRAPRYLKLSEPGARALLLGGFGREFSEVLLARPPPAGRAPPRPT
ncbi:hypothetical protein EVAR_30375_1 [Eumeta japonica]|uniref:Uncharacterized protein n=1 Tax=Eumeta variegata TaxID=151549 RepID=A0A4C1W3Y7_EUMVA|nr:hypothetical protein EVAR_30375_1 [Eumeta japonica]